MTWCLVSREYPPFSGGGIGTYAHSMTRAMVRSGEHPIVITVGPGERTEGIEDGVTVVRLPLAQGDDWSSPHPAIRSPETRAAWQALGPHSVFAMQVADELDGVVLLEQALHELRQVRRRVLAPEQDPHHLRHRLLLQLVLDGRQRDEPPQRLAERGQLDRGGLLEDRVRRAREEAEEGLVRRAVAPQHGQVEVERLEQAQRRRLAVVLPAEGLADDLLLHRITQQTNMVVQQANRYIDSQAPWALRKTDAERMQTVLWVLLETKRKQHTGVYGNITAPKVGEVFGLHCHSLNVFRIRPLS